MKRDYAVVLIGLVFILLVFLFGRYSVNPTVNKFEIKKIEIILIIPEEVQDEVPDLSAFLRGSQFRRRLCSSLLFLQTGRL